MAWGVKDKAQKHCPVSRARSTFLAQPAENFECWERRRLKLWLISKNWALLVLGCGCVPKPKTGQKWVGPWLDEAVSSWDGFDLHLSIHPAVLCSVLSSPQCFIFSCKWSSDSLCAASGCGILKGDTFVFKLFGKMLVLLEFAHFCVWN